MHTAEPFVPEPSASESEVAIGKLERCKCQGVEQIPELIQEEEETLLSNFHTLLSYLEKRIASPIERVNCGTYSQKGR
jgi:hypothetical protein